MSSEFTTGNGFNAETTQMRHVKLTNLKDKTTCIITLDEARAAREYMESLEPDTDGEYPIEVKPEFVVEVGYKNEITYSGAYEMIWEFESAHFTPDQAEKYARKLAIEEEFVRISRR